MPNSFQHDVLNAWLAQASDAGEPRWYQLTDQLWLRGQADPRHGWAGMEFRGELDASSSHELTQAFRTLLDADVTSIDLDMSEVSDLDGASARGLASAAGAVEARGGHLRVRNATDSAAMTLERTGLGRLLLPPHDLGDLQQH